jgi:hypothetical protein
MKPKKHNAISGGKIIFIVNALTTRLLAAMLLAGLFSTVTGGCGDDDDTNTNPRIAAYCAHWQACDPDGFVFDSVNQCEVAMQQTISEQVAHSGPECEDAYDDMMQCFDNTPCPEIVSGTACIEELNTITLVCEQSD